MDTLVLTLWLLILAALVIIDIVIFVKKRNDYDGVFRINTTNPDKDVYSLELNDILGDLEHKKEIRLKVVNESSQEKPLA